MPTAIPVTPTSMNYASAVFVFFAAVSVFWYVVRGRKSFSGPPVPADDLGQDGETVEGLGKVTTQNSPSGRMDESKLVSNDK